MMSQLRTTRLAVAVVVAAGGRAKVLWAARGVGGRVGVGGGLWGGEWGRAGGRGRGLGGGAAAAGRLRRLQGANIASPRVPWLQRGGKPVARDHHQERIGMICLIGLSL